jgi:hypothetical protein
MIKILNYINGELVGPNSGAYIDNYNPAVGRVYSLVPDSDAQTVRLSRPREMPSRFGLEHHLKNDLVISIAWRTLSIVTLTNWRQQKVRTMASL